MSAFSISITVSIKQFIVWYVIIKIIQPSQLESRRLEMSCFQSQSQSQNPKFAIKEDWGNQQVFPFEKLEPVNLHFC